ncbi:hypothetical protein GGS21DRAFT_538996 [Xylaria nigripes]|nr:hypothetical protein GGS21DRAFT_538996 [Xylaria nigripes]
MPESFEQAILGVSWSLTIVSLAAVATRFYLRKRFKIAISSDDWFMLLAEFFQWVYLATVTKSCMAGMGAPLSTLHNSDVTEANKWGYISTPFSNVVSVVARISITILLVRIFGTRRWFTWSMIVTSGAITLLGAANIILIWSMCSPPEALWDKSIGKCLDSRIQEYLTLTLQLLFSISDVLYVVFPVTFVYKLNLATRKKVGLAILLGLSLITAAAAFSKVATNIAFANADTSTNASQLFTIFGIMTLLTAVEQALVITIGCVPTLRPIVLIKIPVLSAIGHTLASLLSSTKRSGSSASKGTSSTRHKHQRQAGPYQDLELSAPYDTSGERIMPPSSVTKVHTGAALHASDLGNTIHRTDDYTVTYNDVMPLKHRKINQRGAGRAY